VISAACVNTFNSTTAFWGFMGFLIYGFVVSAALAVVMHYSDERNVSNIRYSSLNYSAN
jgi:hypothetical protein